MKVIRIKCVLLIAFLSLSFTPKEDYQNNRYTIKTIVIDPGHGGHDHGCNGKTSKEKNIALGIALKLGQYIENTYPEISVVYTRKKDVFIPLYKRAEIANRHKADLFISIHCNSTPTRSARAVKVRGTETFVLGLHRADDNLDVAKRENAVILMEKDYKENYGDFDPNSPEAHIMFSMYQGAYLDQSILLASKIEKQFVAHAKRSSRGVKQAGFLVLRETTMPSVLIESGFLTNATEEKYLSTADGQKAMAMSIFKAFKEYKTEVEDLMVLKSEAKSLHNTAKSVPALVYKIQVGASGKLLESNHPLRYRFNDLTHQKQDSIYKYYTGTFYSYEQCKQQLTAIQEQGFEDAFIVAFNNGKRITLAAAREME